MIKHSGTCTAHLTLSGTPDSLHLCVSDFGVGFDPESMEDKRGLGLVSMQERVRGVGGEIIIESQPSCGTRINVRVPVPHGGVRAEKA